MICKYLLPDYIPCLFTFFIVSFDGKVFYFDESSLSIFFFFLNSWCHLRHHSNLLFYFFSFLVFSFLFLSNSYQVKILGFFLLDTFLF